MDKSFQIFIINALLNTNSRKKYQEPNIAFRIERNVKKMFVVEIAPGCKHLSHSFPAASKSVFESFHDRLAAPAGGRRFHKLTNSTVIGGRIKPVIAAVTIRPPSSL